MSAVRIVIEADDSDMSRADVVRAVEAAVTSAGLTVWEVDVREGAEP